MKPKQKTKCVIYTRFSPQKNSGDKESCEVQEDKCRTLAKKAGYQVVAVYHDKAMSGASAERPLLWEAITSLKRGDVLLVYKLDRLARDVYLMECIRREVARAKGVIEAVEGDIEGDSNEANMMRQILAVFAEYERNCIGQRTKAAMLWKQRNGERVGRFAPYGFLIDPDNPKKIKENWIEQTVLKLIRELHGQGLTSWQIAGHLNRNGYESRSGTSWDCVNVSRIVERNRAQWEQKGGE